MKKKHFEVFKRKSEGGKQMKKNILKYLKEKAKEALSFSNIIFTIIDVLVAILILFTFWGETLIGRNLSISYLSIIIFLNLTYVIYKSICKVQDELDEMKKK